MTARWKVYDGPQISPIFSGIVCMISASDRLIAVTTEDETPVDPSTWSEIARLIAAAPDLLEALKVASDELAVHHNKVAHASIPLSYKATLIDRIEPIYDKINAAIAKAEGLSHA